MLTQIYRSVADVKRPLDEMIALASQAFTSNNHVALDAEFQLRDSIGDTVGLLDIKYRLWRVHPTWTTRFFGEPLLNETALLTFAKAHPQRWKAGRKLVWTPHPTDEGGDRPMPITVETLTPRDRRALGRAYALLGSVLRIDEAEPTEGGMPTPRRRKARRAKSVRRTRRANRNEPVPAELAPEPEAVPA